MKFILIYLLLINLITFISYGLDKRAAIKGKRRTRERTLHLMALMGGSPAALFAQKKFRHKTAKLSFRITYWAIVVLQVIVLLALTYRWTVG